MIKFTVVSKVARRIAVRMAIISRITMLRLHDDSGLCARLVRAAAISGEAGAVPCDFLDSTAAFVDAFDSSNVFSAAER